MQHLLASFLGFPYGQCQYITPNPYHNTLLPGKMLQKLPMLCQIHHSHNGFGFGPKTSSTLQLRYVRKFVCFRLNLGNLYGKSMGNVWMQMTQLGGAEAAATFLHGASRKPGVKPETKRHSFGNSA